MMATSSAPETDSRCRNLSGAACAGCRDGFNYGGYDKAGYNKDGFNKEGYDKDGYDRFHYDKAGYDKDGWDVKVRLVLCCPREWAGRTSRSSSMFITNNKIIFCTLHLLPRGFGYLR